MSELRDILSKIDLEVESLRQMQGYAITARHDFIQRKLEVLSRAYDRMEGLIGADHSVAVINRAMERMHEAMKEAKNE